VFKIWRPIPLPQALRNEHIQAIPPTIRDVEGALHVLDLMRELEHGAGDPACAPTGNVQVENPTFVALVFNRLSPKACASANCAALTSVIS
jgi:hypothetical protein